MKRLEQALDDRCGSAILPFLWMKGEDYETVVEELDAIERCGIREVCLESRPFPDFCGEKWWAILDRVLPEMKRRGMRVWILDDRKFPTGYANGGFERRPELAKRYLAERHVDIMGPCHDSAMLVENFYGDNRLLAVLAVPKPDSESYAVSGDGIIDLTDNIENGFVYFDLPEGAYRLFVLFITSEQGGREHYMNLIDERSVRVLLDEVYEPHYAHYREYFGSTIAGFFSDEPELGNVKGYPFDSGLGQGNVRLPWSDQLEQMLRARWQEAFTRRLIGLWYEAGAHTARTRSDYMDCVTTLVHRCFSGQVGDWCRSHHVEYIGHIIEDANAHTRLACSIGHYFREMEGQDMAGIDLVHHQIVPGFTGKIHQWIAGDTDGEFFHFALAKLGSSAAHIDPRKKGRALCEIFGNYGWAEGVSLMKWLTNHMLVRGINVFVPHAFSMTYPDRDCPPHFYARGNNPQFGAFQQLMRYMQRCCHLLGGGRAMLDAAVLYHAEAEWCGGRTQLYQKPVRALAERQMDCDVLPCDVLNPAHARVEEHCLVVNGYRYPCLILPTAEGLRADAAAFIAQATAQGLPVYAVDSLSEKDCALQPLPDDVLSVLRAHVRVVPLEQLAERVAGETGAFISAEGTWPGLRAMRMRYDDGVVVMFFNEHTTQSVDTQVRFALQGCEAAVLYDPWKQETRTVSVASGRMRLHLYPGEAIFCVLDQTAKAPDQPLRLVSSQVLDTAWEVSRADELHYGEFTPYLHLEAGQKLPNLNGRGYDPAFTGFYRYDGAFEADIRPGWRYLLHLKEGGDTAEVFVNGQSLGYVVNFPSSLDVTHLLRSGRNELRLEFSTTLVWKRKDGASTHLQVYGTGLLAQPVLQCLATV